MAPRTKLKPDVTIGELLLLSQLVEAQVRNPKKSPSVQLQVKHGYSRDAVGGALKRIGEAVGPVEILDNGKRTYLTTDLGRNVGSIGWIANKLMEMAAAPDADQAAMKALLREIGQRLIQRS